MTGGYGSFRLLSLFAETHVHTGSGEADMSVDLPVIREATTDYPYVPGSSLKGSLRYAAARSAGSDKYKKFIVEQACGKGGSGDEGAAGTFIVSDARLLLLPVRSLDRSFYWCTTPLILSRLNRDCQRAGIDIRVDVPQVPMQTVLASTSGDAYLEDLKFTQSINPGDHAKLVESLKPFLLDQTSRDQLSERLLVLNDDDFKWFARYGLPTRARNALDSGRKTVKQGALWYEEYIPPETVFTLVLGERVSVDAARLLSLAGSVPVPADAGSLYEEFQKLAFKAATGCYLQVGGNETIGHGWFALAQIPEAAANVSN